MKIIEAPTCDICGKKITGIYPPRGYNKMTLKEKEDAIEFSYAWALKVHKQFIHNVEIKDENKY